MGWSCHCSSSLPSPPPSPFFFFLSFFFFFFFLFCFFFFYQGLEAGDPEVKVLGALGNQVERLKVGPVDQRERQVLKLRHVVRLAERACRLNVKINKYKKNKRRRRRKKKKKKKKKKKEERKKERKKSNNKTRRTRRRPRRTLKRKSKGQLWQFFVFRSIILFIAFPKPSLSFYFFFFFSFFFYIDVTNVTNHRCTSHNTATRTRCALARRRPARPMSCGRPRPRSA